MRNALVLVLTGFSALSVEGADDKEKAEFKKLEGTWALVSTERNGEKRFPPKELWVFEGEAAKVYFVTAPPNAPKNWSPPLEPMNVLQIYHFKLDPTQTPKALDKTTEYRDKKTLEFGDKKSPSKPENLTKKPKLGIYKLEGDTLTICFAGYYDKGKRPGEFTAAKMSDRVIYVLQREKM